MSLKLIAKLSLEKSKVEIAFVLLMRRLMTLMNANVMPQITMREETMFVFVKMVTSPIMALAVKRSYARRTSDR